MGYRPLLAVAALLLVALPAIAQQPGPAPRDEDPNRLICRSTLDTGSLVRRKRQCFTRAQWERIGQAAREGATDMQDRLRMTCGHVGCPEQ